LSRRRQVFQLIGGPLSVQSLVKAYGEHFDELEGVTRPTVATKNGDDDLIETYLKHAGLTGYPEREARETWALFRELCPGVKLKDATRDHGRKLVEYLTGKGLRTASVQHKVGRLTAAVNFSIKEGKLKFNPFSGVVPKATDSERRLPFDDADMKLIRENLDKLTPSDRLMVTVLATTGMRLGEAFHISREGVERGLRYVIVGSKNDQSLRRVPLPAKLLLVLSDKIKGQLFPDDDGHKASRRLNRFLRKVCGITDPHKVVHSFRHRAQDRLRAAECPSDIRHAILGHDDRSVAEGYGEGFAVPVLKRWIDRIGF
jgi:integrase